MGISLNSSERINQIEKILSNLTLKDAILDKISDYANIAQFVSYSPYPDFKQRFVRIHGVEPNFKFRSIEKVIEALLESSIEKTVNIRSFDSKRPKEGTFIYGLKNIKDVINKVYSLAHQGFFTIVNETINTKDGGVSGVVYGGIMEFAPDDTPRCVEKPGIFSAPFNFGIRLLEKVYGFRPSIKYPQNFRVEFSIHPIRRGFHKDHTIIWEIEQLSSIRLETEVIWPNNFSTLIGDKAFGLLVADLLGFPIPLTTVISRRISPFKLGRPTGTQEFWIRSCPKEPVPGHYSTHHGWRDPFKLLEKEDPKGKEISSILSQEGVNPVYSGAAKTNLNGDPYIEGVKGTGDDYMLGLASPEELPNKVKIAVKHVLEKLHNYIKQVEIEWVYDGKKAWVIQLKKRKKNKLDDATLSAYAIFPGNADFYYRFDVSKGLSELRKLISKVKGTGKGIIIQGDIGIMSHFGDLLRIGEIPSKIVPKGSNMNK